MLKEKPLISIIVPVYRTPEKFLRECVDSLLNQNFLLLEIILVDDGSPDECGAICDSCKSQDSRVKVIHQENKGVSVARNVGLKESSAEYVTFLDSDDYFERDALLRLSSILQKKHPDILIFKMNGKYCQNTGRIVKIEQKRDVLSRILLPASRYDYLADSGCKIYNRNFLMLNNLTFPQNIVYAEDRVFNFCAFNRAQSIYEIDLGLYKYRQHSESFLHRYTQDAEKKYLAYIEFIKAEKIEGADFTMQINTSGIVSFFQSIFVDQMHRDNHTSVKKKMYEIRNLCNSEKIQALFSNYDESKLKLSMKIASNLIKKKKYIFFWLVYLKWKIENKFNFF